MPMDAWFLNAAGTASGFIDAVRRAHRPCGLFFLFFLAAAVESQAGSVRYGGRSYTDLADIAARFGMRFEWAVPGDRARLASQWTELSFEGNQRSFQLNGYLVYLGYAVLKQNGQLYVADTDLEKTLQPILTPQVFATPPRLRRVVIDPGHGGNDPGALNTGLKLQEKSLVLDLAKRLQQALQAKGYEVILTRSSDVFVELADRAAFANKKQADLFISLHFNSSTKASVEGIETFAFTPRYHPSTSRSRLTATDKRGFFGNQNDPWNVLLAFYVQRALVERTSAKDRGVKRARFTVLEQVKMPAILVEGGFVSHPREGRNTGSANYRQKIANAIVEGIEAYDRTIERIR